MKSIFITGHEPNIIKALSAEAQKFSEIEVIGSGELDETVKQNCSFDQPDFIITGNISAIEAKELLELCVSTNIIMVSNDMNRANNVINQLQQENIYRCTAVDLSHVSPPELCDYILNFQIDTQETNDMFSDNSIMSETEILNDSASNVEVNQNVQMSAEETTERPFEQLNTDNNTGFATNNDSPTPSEIKQNSFNVNINNVRSKVITVHSKKGGVGKTNIAKEMCNVYSSVKLPKKLQNGNEFLKACVVDFDFERGNMRTYLGIDNPSPNIYVWINDILDRIDNKADISKISFNQFQVMGYVKKIENNGNYYSLITAQGSLPVRTLSRISKLDEKGDLLEKILKIIIKSLKKTFDVIIIDTDTDFNEITKVAFEQSDNIIYVLNPTIADIENLKVFVDEVSTVDTIDLNKVGLIINKYSKHITFRNEMLDVLSLVKYKDVNFATGDQIEKNLPLISDIPFDEAFINLNNGYLFATNNATQEVKKGILKACEFCLPIFKIKHTTAGLAELQKQKARKEMLEKKKKKLEASKAKSKTDKKAQAIKDLKNPEPKVESVTDNASEVAKTDKTVQSANDYLNSNLASVSCEDFVTQLKTFPEVKKTKTGYPILKKKPLSISKKVWKQYSKMLQKEAVKSQKMKRAEG